MLTATSQYALRALTELAALPEGAVLLGRELAERCDIPAQYLTHILASLGKAGLVAAARGRHGGYHLIRSPRQIPLVHVVEIFEGPKDEPRCFLHGDRPCGGRGRTPCPAHAAWENVQTAYTYFLKTTTLDHILPSPNAFPA